MKKELNREVQARCSPSHTWPISKWAWTSHNSHVRNMCVGAGGFQTIQQALWLDRIDAFNVTLWNRRSDTDIHFMQWLSSCAEVRQRALLKLSFLVLCATISLLVQTTECNTYSMPSRKDCLKKCTITPVFKQNVIFKQFCLLTWSEALPPLLRLLCFKFYLY